MPVVRWERRFLLNDARVVGLNQGVAADGSTWEIVTIESKVVQTHYQTDKPRTPPATLPVAPAKRVQATQAAVASAAAIGAPGGPVAGDADIDRALGGAALWAADKIDQFQQTELGRNLQALPPEGAVAGGLKVGLLGVARLAKAGEAAKGAVDGFGFTRSQLQHAFKHAKDFGVTGSANNRTLSEFSSVLQSHVDAAGTRVIQGTYRGNPVTHHIDPATGLNVIRDSSGNFLSGWKLSPQQLQHVLTTGKLGGG